MFAFLLVGCKDKNKKFVVGDNELIMLSFTPKGGVETYQVYTTNIMIYTDGTVKVYASDFIRWFGDEEIPELTLSLDKDKIEEIIQIIKDEDLYNLRENVGNKDGIDGLIRQMTIYSANGTNTTGGISVSNRQFVRAYEKIESMVREDLYLYNGAINEIQYEGYLEFNNRNVQLLDKQGKVILDHELINNVDYGTEEASDKILYYTVVEFNQDGEEILYEISVKANEEEPVFLTLMINDKYETEIIIDRIIHDNKLYIYQISEENASQLAERIREGLR